MSRIGFALTCVVCLLAAAGPAAAVDSGFVAAPVDGGYRWSLSRGPLDVGVLFEARTAAARPIDARFDSAAPAGSTLPALWVGLRNVSVGPAPASTLVERALGATTDVPYESKVGIQWKPAPSQVFLNQGLGLRLGGDDRLTMRLRKGSLGLYMKRTF